MIITALANIDNIPIQCEREIEILRITKQIVYATWVIYANKKMLASRSRQYFLQENIDPKDALIEQIIKNIENYRIGRKKIFVNAVITFNERYQ